MDGLLSLAFEYSAAHQPANALRDADQKIRKVAISGRLSQKLIRVTDSLTATPGASSNSFPSLPIHLFEVEFGRFSPQARNYICKPVAEPQQSMTLTTLSEAELLRLMAAGDEDAFVALYRRHQGPVFRFALLMSGQASIAEEVTQEVFLTLMREPSRFDATRGAFPAYLHGVARNHVLRLLKRERPYVPLVTAAEDANEAAQFVAREDPFRDCTHNETSELVRQAVLSLPARYREVVVLCDFQELSLADAAAALNCPVGTVNSRLHRGHALLLKKLCALGEQDSTAHKTQALRCFA